MDDKTRTELEAAAFRRLVAHLQERTDVQNIDMMNLAGFCRNCLSRWYREEAGKQGIEIADPKAREVVDGMPYDEWKAKHQKEASGDQKKAFDKADKHGLDIAHPSGGGLGLIATDTKATRYCSSDLPSDNLRDFSLRPIPLPPIPVRHSTPLSPSFPASRH